MSIEKTYTVNTYEVFAVSWSGHIATIPELGISQLRFFYRSLLSTTWIEITKSSFERTYQSTNQSVDLTNATTTIDGAEVPVNLSKATHEVRILRDTSKLLYITFQEGSKLSSKDLNSVNLQPIHLVEEEESERAVADTAIYTHIAQELGGYYTKEQIDGFFGGLTLPNWSAGRTYIVGDTVLHDDPNTAASTLLIWYCGIDHTSTAADAPSATGVGASFWTNVAPDTTLDNLNYIRKLPGLNNTPGDWNTITPQTADAKGLIFKPEAGFLGDLTQYFTSIGTLVGGVKSKSSNILEFTMGTRFNLVTESETNLASKIGKVYIGYDTVDTLSASGAKLSVRSTTPSGTAFRCIRSGATDDVLGSNILLNVDDDGVTAYDSFAALKGQDVENTATTISSKRIEIGATSKGCVGSYTGVQGGTLGSGFLIGELDIPNQAGQASTYLDQNIRMYRDVDVGTATGTPCVYTSRITLDAGNGQVEALEFKDSTLANATYLSADANGVIQKETGSIPATNRVGLSVTGSNTTLVNTNVVYLDNTGVWAKAVRTDQTKLAVGVIDDKTGADGNQSFTVVFCGLVDGFSSLTVGDWCWLSNTAGGITQTAPSGSGDIIDPVGIAITATSIMVMPARPHQLPT
tara:strand:+ start:109 stop:2010 length:1902 start_codon:yes stop_codon:yes gene_type:complete